MNSLLTLAKDLEQKSKTQQQRTGEILKAAFSAHEQSVRAELTASAERISTAIREHEKGMNTAMQQNRLNVLRMVGRTWLTVTMVSVLLIATSGSILWWQGRQITDNYMIIREQKDSIRGQKETLSKLNGRTWGVSYQESNDGRRFLVMPEGTQAEVIPHMGTDWILLKQE
ncbi:TPA: MbeB family mobilization protein [Morganella morganii]|nr:MbeB family mobilization protein [Morganella morganii]